MTLFNIFKNIVEIEAFAHKEYLKLSPTEEANGASFE